MRAPHPAGRPVTSPRATGCWRWISTRRSWKRSAPRRAGSTSRTASRCWRTTRPSPFRRPSVWSRRCCSTPRAPDSARSGGIRSCAGAGRSRTSRGWPPSSGASWSECQEVVPPAGLLVYAVCSTEPEEGQDQIDLFLRSHPDFTLETPALAERLGWPLAQGALRTLPGPDGMDGFYAARLRRVLAMIFRALRRRSRHMPALQGEARMPRALLVAALCLTAVPALAFEGVIETKMTADRRRDGAPEARRSRSTGAARSSDQGPQHPDGPGDEHARGGRPEKQRSSTARTSQTSPTSSTTPTRPTEAHRREGRAEGASEWTVKKLGKDTVAGRCTEHVQVQRASGERHPRGVDRHRTSSPRAIWRRRSTPAIDVRAAGGSALRKAGVAGIPLKVIAKNEHGEPGVTWEARR